ncbi:MAG TPA: PAS domain S-box protein [Acidimicrobiia bacterium]|nr:PAS domain S-box protein [Acidimicrobiia bacterium]
MTTNEQVAFLVALDGAVVGWGAGAESLFGYHADELVGQPVSVLAAPEATSAFPRILSAVARGEGVEATETMVGKDGTRFEVALAVSPARNGGGRITGARAVVRDVTDEATEEARGRLAALLEALNDAVYTLDVKGVIRTWNPGAERLYGYKGHEAVGLPGLSLVPEARHDDARMAIDCVLAGEPVQLFEIDARRKDGVLVPAQVDLWPIRSRSGEVAGVSVIVNDQTEQRLAEAALAESVVRLRESESLAHVGGWVWDMATGAVQWSEELHRIHGLDPAGFAGSLDAHLALVHPYDREPVRAGMQAAVAGPHPFEMEYRIVRPNGEVRWLYARAEVALAPSDSVAVAGLRGICQDITERKRARIPAEVTAGLRWIVDCAERLRRAPLSPAEAAVADEIAELAKRLLEEPGNGERLRPVRGT